MKKGLFTLLILMLFIGYTPTNTNAQQLPLPGETPAHALILNLDSTGQATVLDYSVVFTNSVFNRDDVTPRDSATQQPTQDPLYDYVLVQLLDDTTNAVVYQTVERVSRWIRGEFALDPNDLSVTNAQGSNIDGHKFAAQDRVFSVKVPIIAGASRLTVSAPNGASASGENPQTHIDLNLASKASQPRNSTPAEQILLSGYPIENSGNRRDIVIVGDGYRSSEKATFAAHAKTLADGLFTIEPFKSYKKYFNVVGVFGASTESGADQPASCPDNNPLMNGQMKNTRYDSTFCYNGIARLLYAQNTAAIMADVNAIYPDAENIFVIVNDTTYGGSGGDMATVSTHASAIQILQHEVGHSIMYLDDEYDLYTPGYPGCSDKNRDGISVLCLANVTDVNVRQNIKWNYWINGSTPIPTTGFMPTNIVGLWLGAHYSPTTYYRSCYNCMMRSLGVDFGPLADEQLALTLYNSSDESIDIIDDKHLLPAHGSTHEIDINHNFQVSLKALSPSNGDNTRVRWQINDETVQEDWVSHLEESVFYYEPPSAGTYKMSVAVVDMHDILHSSKRNLSRSTVDWKLIVVGTRTPTPKPSQTLTPDPTGTPTAEPTEPTSEPTPTGTVTATETATATTEPTDPPAGTTELLVNGDFEALENPLTGWTQKKHVKAKVKCNKPAKGKVIAYEGECAYQFKSISGVNSKLMQIVDVSQPFSVGDTLTFDGMVFAKGVFTTKAKVRVKYTDPALPKGKITVSINTSASEYMPFDAYSDALSITLAGEPQKIKVQLSNKGSKGKVRYDALSLLWTQQDDVAPLPLPISSAQ